MSEANGIVAIIDVPAKSTIILDGIVKTILVDGFVGFCEVPREVFHLVVVRGARTFSSHNDNEHTAQPSMQTSGLVVFKESNSKPDIWAVAHKYELESEEISKSPLDDSTIKNLVSSINNDFIEPRRLVSYHHFMQNESGDNPNSWSHELVNFISLSILRRRGLKGDGEKIVPSSYNTEDDDQLKHNTRHYETDNDGKIIIYPPIPCISLNNDQIRNIQHSGTKKYLKRLSPSAKTSLFLNTKRGDKILDDILNEYYGNKWQDLIGDLQLSFVIFLTMSCFSSLEHWRDILSMTSFTSTESVKVHLPLFRNLIKCLISQMKNFGNEFFQEVSYTDGNFLIPAIQRIYSSCLSYNDEILKKLLYQLALSFKTTFYCDIVPTGRNIDRDTVADSFIEKVELHETDREGVKSHVDFDDDDAPLIVSTEDYEASLARCNLLDPPTKFTISELQQNSNLYREKYPLLFSSNMSHEDIMMTCARILDEKNDVSLVREAAAYLYEINAIK